MRMLKIVFAFSVALPLCPHDIITTKLTFAREVSRIMARRCVGCHAEQASIPLVSYAQVRPWAVSIKEQVLSRQMPPWGAVKGFGDLSPDNGLTQEEILILSAWVVGGSPEGNPAFLPHSEPVVSAKLSPLQDALIVDNRMTVKKRLSIAGIRPIGKGDVASARIVATYPDGHIEPLLWLFQYHFEWNRSFRFDDALTLPAGTSIQSDSPLQFALQH